VLDPVLADVQVQTLGVVGHAQPGQSKPPFSWFIRWVARVPATSSRLCANTFALRAAPQPAEGSALPWLSSADDQRYLGM
jgi:hypothetical protein